MPADVAGDHPGFARGNITWSERVNKERRQVVKLARTESEPRVVAASCPGTNGWVCTPGFNAGRSFNSPTRTVPCQWIGDTSLPYVSHSLPRRLVKEGVYNEARTQVFGSPLFTPASAFRQTQGVPTYVTPRPFTSYHSTAPLQEIHPTSGVLSSRAPWQPLSAQQRWCGHV